MSEPAADDVMSQVAGIAAGSAADAARALRPDVIRFTQTSDEAMLRPKSEAGFTRGERAAVGLRVARQLEDKALAAHYEVMLPPLDPSGALLAATQATASDGGDRVSHMLAHADRLTTNPGASASAHLAQLAQAGLSPQ